jgi:hypothetical protein
MMDMQVKEVVGKYLIQSGLSLRGFAAALTERIQGEVSHPTVISWRDGKSEPSSNILALILIRYRDWRFDFALEALEAKAPEIWGRDDGGIWQVARDLEGKNGSG